MRPWVWRSYDALATELTSTASAGSRDAAFAVTDAALRGFAQAFLACFK